MVQAALAADSSCEPRKLADAITDRGPEPPRCWPGRSSAKLWSGYVPHGFVPDNAVMCSMLSRCCCAGRAREPASNVRCCCASRGRHDCFGTHAAIAVPAIVAAAAWRAPQLHAVRPRGSNTAGVRCLILAAERKFDSEMIINTVRLMTRHACRQPLASAWQHQLTSPRLWTGSHSRRGQNVWQWQ